jgi:hypothetical protein
LPIAFKTSDISNSAVGQTSGQWVKPKKITVGRPFIFFSVTVWPACRSIEGTADRGRCGDGAQASHRPQHQHEPDQQAGSKGREITSGRAVRGIMNFLSRSEAGRDAGGDHLKEHRGPVMEPERYGTERHNRAKAGGTPDDRRSHPAARLGCRDHSVRVEIG